MAQINSLSRREQDVVNLLLQGKSNKLIALALHVSENTVEFHLKNIYAKLQVNSRMELALKLGSASAEKLRDSVVAEVKEPSENRERLKFIWKNWVASSKEAVSIIGKELKMDNVANGKNETEALTFYESIRVCFIKYAEFNGKATRPEFWWFALFIALGASALAYLGENLSSIFLIATLLPLLAVGARRLNDAGKSPWLQLYLLVPVAGFIIVGIFWAQPPAVSSAPENQATA